MQDPGTKRGIALKEALLTDPHVRQRIIEYLGGPPLEHATAIYISKSDMIDSAPQVGPGELDSFLRESPTLARSLWDRNYILCHLDIDYVNFDSAADELRKPRHAFGMQACVELQTKKILANFEILPLQLVSGRGHHFVWQVPASGELHDRLGALGWLSSDVAARYAEPHSPHGEPVPQPMARAYSGLGLVMEYLAHLIKVPAAVSTPIPIELTAMAVGSGIYGRREAISLDISEYGDPLWLRVIRVPFTLYGKAEQEPFQESGLDPRTMLPLGGLSVDEVLTAMTDAGAVLDLARRCRTNIPVCEHGTARLADEYSRSALRRFHSWFYSQEHEPYERWPATYDNFFLGLLPPPAQSVLQHPNPTLLKPAGMELVTRCLLALGWHPRHIAGLIRSKFERDYGWGSYWYHYDASLRADFYVRTVAGLICTGIDNLADFNAQSTLEKGLAHDPLEAADIGLYRNSLLHRRASSRLGTEPFNELL